MKTVNGGIKLLLSFAMTCAMASVARAQTFTVLYSFTGGTDGGGVGSGVVMDKQGNLYGTTTGGGAYGYGTVFELSPNSDGTWSETVLHSFKNGDPDGQEPDANLILDAAGNLYGTTQGGALFGVTGYGGTGLCLLLGSKAGCGTVYELIPPATSGGAWTETVIYNFLGTNDGYFPTGELVSDKQGNLYGATYFGGGLGQCDQGIYLHCGMVFELSPPSAEGGAWTEKVLYSFTNGPNGAQPNGSPVFDTKGSLYGTTQYGGTLGCTSTSGKGCGIVFKLTPPATKGGAWSESVIHSFSTRTSDGASPFAGVIFDKLGNLYGTTYAGGNAWPAHAGAVYELSPPRLSGEPWIETLLCSFGFGRTGANPTAGLTFDGQGNLYGTTGADGEYGAGTTFRLGLPSTMGGKWTLDILHAFQRDPDAASPSGTLVFGRGGSIFGVAGGGGSGEACGIGIGCGAIYEIAP
ncbi:MAG TPA: choice-of-anchor tandem repeat GloVer-containing protein [Candidatus Sulfotelmatobacter sp.]